VSGSPEAVEENIAEIADLFPALAAALTRDNAPSDGRGVLSAGGVVNADVLHAMILLTAEVPAACTIATGITGEPWQRRPLATCLRAIPRFHERLTIIGRLDAATSLESAVARWRRTVKLALGLCTPDTRIGFDCPLHEEPSPLLMAGAEGFIRPGHTVVWVGDGRIHCRFCGEAWPVWQWRRLGLLLENA